MATTITTLNLKDGTRVTIQVDAGAGHHLTLQDYSGKVLRALTIDEAKALLEAAGFVVE